MTLSPGATWLTPAPTSSTTPAASCPRMAGTGKGIDPSARWRSEWQTPQWATRTWTCRGPGPSTSTSSTTAMSWPGASSSAALMAAPAGACSAQLGQREGEAEAAPLWLVGLVPGVAALGLGQLADDRQSQPGPADVSLRGRRPTGEASEQVGHEVAGHTLASIADRHHAGAVPL